MPGCAASAASMSSQHDRLRDQEDRGAEEAREGLGAGAEPVVAEDRGEVQVGSVKPKMVGGLVGSHPSDLRGGVCRPPTARSIFN